MVDIDVVLHRYEILADIPITDILDWKRADILSQSDIIYKPSQSFMLIKFTYIKLNTSKSIHYLPAYKYILPPLYK